MFTTMFFARFFGLFFLILGVFMIVRIDHMRGVMKDTLGYRPLLFFTGIIALILGLAVVVSHDIWSGWPVVITLIGWILLISGCLRMFLPDQVAPMLDPLLRTNAYWVLPIVVLVLAVFLCYHGFGSELFL